jgi:hypothetical protein
MPSDEMPTDFRGLFWLGIMLVATAAWIWLVADGVAWCFGF